MIENIVIGIIFAGAMWYLASKFYSSFTQKGSCEKGCSNCSVAEIEKIANMYKDAVKN